MIKCSKCEGLNDNICDICGFCGTKLPKHKGSRMIELKREEEKKTTKTEIVEIVSSIMLVIIYVMVFSFLYEYSIVINTPLSLIGILISKKYSFNMLKKVSYACLVFILAIFCYYIVLSILSF